MALVYNGWHKVFKTDYKRNGNSYTREKLGIKSAVGCLLTDNAGKVCLIKQYRFAVDKETLEIPAGVLDKARMTPYQVLSEEICEECNIPASLVTLSPQPIIEYHMLIGSSDATMSIYKARYNSVGISGPIMNDEDVTAITWVSPDELRFLINTKEITDSKTIMAYLLLSQA